MLMCVSLVISLSFSSAFFHPHRIRRPIFVVFRPSTSHSEMVSRLFLCPALHERDE